jgi:hypothetical protein
MRSILFILLFNLSFISVAQERIDIVSVGFKTFTRGAGKTILISKDSILITPSSAPGKEAVKCNISKEDWELMLKQIRDINLSDIPALTSPTNRRSVDGAWHSEIIIKTTAQKAFSHSFDNEEPNKKLKSLMQVIAMLEKKYSDAGK